MAGTQLQGLMAVRLAVRWRGWTTAALWSSQGRMLTTESVRGPRAVCLRELLERVSEKAEEVHVVQVAGGNPYANLAVEQRLFERAHARSHVLVLYHNAPCVVVGRNQNPWAEARLRSLRLGVEETTGGGEKGVVLVRRRSGGGAVYHDAGNANWSVHSPAGGGYDFDRDRHAHMVARALRRLGVVSARVNARHDIVVDGDGDATFKVSGSAYKLTTRRSLHHGTCLLGTDLDAVSGLLRSPAAPYVQARGVASVRSPVQNVVLSSSEQDRHARFAAAVTVEFTALYGPAATHSIVDVAAATAADGFAFDPALARGYAELMSPDWLFGQTPQFTFATHPTAGDPRQRPFPPSAVPPAFALSLTARHGRLQDVVVAGLPFHASPVSDADAHAAVAAALDGQLLYTIHNWTAALQAAAPATAVFDAASLSAIGTWLDSLLAPFVKASLSS